MIDDFEQRRWARETANEIVIGYIRGVMLLVILGFHVQNLFTRLAPFRAPMPVLAGLAVMVAINAVLLFYLHRWPPYRPWRKYLITATDTLLMVAFLGQMQPLVPPLVLALLPAINAMLMIVVAGLRYSTGAVALAGGMTVLLNLFVFTPYAPPEFQMALRVFGTANLAMCAFVVAYSVTSMVRLHRESVWRERLSRFLAPELVEEIGRRPEIMQQKTERRTATILFIDIRGFTSLSEHMTPDQVVAFLNLFLDEMTTALMTHHGMLDKYIGDAVMGVFGVPVGGDDDALRAVRAALEMSARLKRLNERLAETGMPQLGVGIGLHTGEVVVGAIGSSQRLDYTVIGDAVNVASRIESLTRLYPVEILLSDTTRAAIGAALPLREVDTVQVKGREQPVTLWTPG